MASKRKLRKRIRAMEQYIAEQAQETATTQPVHVHFVDQHFFRVFAMPPRQQRQQQQQPQSEEEQERAADQFADAQAREAAAQARRRETATA
jgi:hypothetical protein